MPRIIVEHSNGKTTSVGPIGIKKFAALIDTPERIVLSEHEGGLAIKVMRAASNREKILPMTVNGTEFYVGAVSGSIVEVRSGATTQISAALSDERTKRGICSRLKQPNGRTGTNIDASLFLLSKVSK